MKNTWLVAIAVIIIIAAVAISGQISVPQYQTPTQTTAQTQTETQTETTAQTTTTPSVQEIKMTIFHTSYSPNKISVNMGDTVRILATAAAGTSSHLHGVTIDDYGINQVVTTEDANNPVKIEFAANKRGTFKIYCKTCWDGPFGTGHPDIQATLEVK